MHNHILITGCSGGGKSTLITALKEQGHRVIEEPGRRVIAAQRVSARSALPWTDMPAFLDAVLALARQDIKIAGADAPVFFDRGLIDAAVAREFYCGVPIRETLGPVTPYDPRVFLAPPWPEIYHQDADRRHDFDTAQAEYARILSALRSLPYDIRILPKSCVQERVTFVLSHLH